MNFLKRALLSIKRRVGKSIILLILVFVLGNVIAGAISIKQATKNTEINMRKKIGVIASAEIDYDKIPQDPDFDYNSLKQITSEQIEKIGKLPYVDYYDYSITASLISTTLKRFTVDNYEYESDYEYFTIIGVQMPELSILKSGKSELIKGRNFTDQEIKSGENVVIISNTFAELNNLDVGLTVTLLNRMYKPVSREQAMSYTGWIEPEIAFDQEIEFEVVGIYKTGREIKVSDSGNVDFNYMDAERENSIYTPNQVVININNLIRTEIKKIAPEEAEYYSNEDYIVPVFVLSDPMDVDKFKEEATSYLPEYYHITDNAENFNQIAGPMKNMEWIAQIVLYVAIGATVVILSLLITLFLRDRKHEMGIYLSLGEKKKKVMLQIALEVIIISFIGITISLFTGNVLANAMSKEMLKNQMIEDQNNKEQMYYGGTSNTEWLGYGSRISEEDLIESYKVSLGTTTVLIFYAIGLGTVLISTLIPMVYIMRLNPKKIML